MQNNNKNNPIEKRNVAHENCEFDFLDEILPDVEPYNEEFDLDGVEFVNMDLADFLNAKVFYPMTELNNVCSQIKQEQDARGEKKPIKIFI